MTDTKIALITGANKGLGRSAALHLAQVGVDILFTYRSNESEAQGVVAEIEALGRRAVALPLSLDAEADFAAFADTVRKTLDEDFGRDTFDFLLNNAGVGLHAPLADTTPAQFDQLLHVHFRGVFFLTQALLPLVADGGRILNTSTGLTRFSIPGYGAYAAMKAAVESYTTYLAQELGPRGIAVNVIAPGAIATDFGGGAVRDNADVNAYISATTAMGRVGEADDIGEAVAGIFTGLSGWTTGQRIEVSGGQSL